MAFNNVFQALAEQELNRPEREMQQMKLKQLKGEYAYQQQSRSALASMPQTKEVTTPNAQPFSGSLADIQPPPLDLSAKTEQKPLTIVDRWRQQAEYHNSNGRPDLAQEVQNHELEFVGKLATVYQHQLKAGGKAQADNWLRSNPDFVAALGDPKDISTDPSGLAIYPYEGGDGTLGYIIDPKTGEYQHKVPIANQPGKVDGGEYVRQPDGTYQQIGTPKADKTIETWGKPYPSKVGGKVVMLQDSSNGQVRAVVQDNSTTVKVTNGNRSGHTEFKDVMALRKEFSSLPEVKDYSMIQSQSLRAKKALEESLNKNSNMPVDQTVITTFNKLLDPSSVVRESEYARTQQDLSILSRIKGKWDKVQRGGAGLDLSERQALVRMIGNFSEIADAQYNDQVQQYTELAKRNNFDPGDVIRLGHNEKKKANSGAPAAGGYLKKSGEGFVYFP